VARVGRRYRPDGQPEHPPDRGAVGQLPGASYRRRVVSGPLPEPGVDARRRCSGRGLAYLGAGFIEEFAKLAALVFIARGLPRYTIRDGIVLGAAVRFGFAALESSGYALTAVFVRQGGSVGLSLSSLVLTEVIRGVLAPLGHGLWTAILGGVLFGASRGGHLRISRGVVGTYVLVALLHAIWDSMQNIAVFLTEVLTATTVQRVALARGGEPAANRTTDRHLCSHPDRRPDPGVPDWHPGLAARVAAAGTSRSRSPVEPGGRHLTRFIDEDQCHFDYFRIAALIALLVGCTTREETISAVVPPLVSETPVAAPQQDDQTLRVTIFNGKFVSSLCVYPV
jgi:hypothetical protein